VDRDEVIAKLKAVEPQLRAYRVAALYLFGSYARDEARQDSDVDVFVDPGTQDFYSLNHFVGAYEIIRRAVAGREIGYGTRDGLSTYIRPRSKRRRSESSDGRDKAPTDASRPHSGRSRQSPAAARGG